MKVAGGKQSQKAVWKKQPNLDEIQEYAKELLTLGLELQVEFGKEVDCEFSGCGSTCLYSFKQLVMSAISMRLSHPCHSTTTCFPFSFPNNLTGVDLLAPMAHLVKTYLVISTWSILIVCVKMQLVTYRCQQNTESHCNNGQSCLINIMQMHYTTLTMRMALIIGLVHITKYLKQVIFQKLSMRSTIRCLFTNIPGRKHTSFPSITCNMFENINQPNFQDWMDTKFAKTISQSSY